MKINIILSFTLAILLASSISATNEIVFADDDDKKPKKIKTFESECAKKLDKKKLNLDGLFCLAIIEIQATLVNLQTQIDTIQLTPGPQGEVGLTGSQGPAGEQGLQGEQVMPTITKEVITTTISMDIYPKLIHQHLEFTCPNNGIVESRTINFNNIDGVNLFTQNAEILGGSDNFLDGYHGIELDAQRTQDNGASFVRVTMS